MRIITGILAAAWAATVTATGLPPTCNVLALSGGASFGAVEVGILAGLVEEGTIPTNYDIVTGISAGGLNAGFLSYYDEITDALPTMQTIYANLQTTDVYSVDFTGIFKRWSIFDTSPLEKKLYSILHGMTPAVGAPVTLVGSTNLNTSNLDIFTFNEYDLEDKVDILMATSAIPLAFPPRVVNGTVYVDGAVISNELINQAMGAMSCGIYNITFVSAFPQSQPNTGVHDLASYATALFRTLYESFDSQITQMANCSASIGSLQACYPTSPDLSKYSILSFDHGKELYDLGKRHHACFSYPLC